MPRITTLGDRKKNWINVSVSSNESISISPYKLKTSYRMEFVLFQLFQCNKQKTIKTIDFQSKQNMEITSKIWPARTKIPRLHRTKTRTRQWVIRYFKRHNYKKNIQIFTFISAWSTFWKKTSHPPILIFLSQNWWSALTLCYISHCGIQQKLIIFYSINWIY